MPNTAKSDADCIESAYEDDVGAIFKMLVQNLAGEPDNSHDQEHLAQFTKGLGVLKRAKALALGVVGAAPAARTAAMVKPKSGQKRRRSS